MILLKILPWAFLILAFLIGMVWIIGKSQSKLSYKKDYKSLVMYVRNGLVNQANHDFIVRKFSLIKKYKCRDEECLRLLEDEFKGRYKEFQEPPDEFSPEAVFGKIGDGKELLGDLFLPDLEK